MKAKSIKGKSAEEIKTELEKITGDGFNPTLAIVFLSIKQDRQAITNLLDEKGISIYGATTNGEFIDENYEQGTIAILLFDINPTYFIIQFAELKGSEDRKITAGLATEAVAKFRHPALLVTGCSLQTDIEDMLAGFTDVLGSNANIVGAMAGDDTSFTEQFVFTNGKSASRAVVTIVFDEDKIFVKGRAAHGWKAVGTEKTVTRSEGNRIYSIDNVPALDLCLKYSGLPIDAPNLTLELVTNFPLQLQRKDGTSFMRPAYKIMWEDHSLLTSGKIMEGAKVRFSLPPDFDVIEKVIDENKSMKETEVGTVDALVIYNCGGRLMTFGPLIAEEIKGMKEVWNAPLAGMFSHGEIGPTKDGSLGFHNLTTCWVALKEK
jgi:hypothetical protein